MASKEHEEFAQAMDLIDLMPPGLYEAVISDVDEHVANPDLITGRYLMTLEKRTLDDIRALGGNGPEDELRFATVARVSEINQGHYRSLASPAVRALATPEGAEAMRRMHPNRLRFEAFSDQNPMMGAVGGLAEIVRANRRSVEEDNPFLAAERMMADLISTGLKNWGEARDLAAENLFLGVYGSPWLQALVGLRSEGAMARPRLERELSREATADRAAAYLEQHPDRGGLLEATTRALLYVRLAEGSADEHGFAALMSIAAELPASMRVGFARFKEVVKEQFMVLFLDEARAVAAIPALLPDNRRQRGDALRALHRVLTARGELPEESARRFAEIEAMFGPPAANGGGETSPAHQDAAK